MYISWVKLLTITVINAKMNMKDIPEVIPLTIDDHLYLDTHLKFLLTTRFLFSGILWHEMYQYHYPQTYREKGFDCSFWICQSVSGTYCTHLVFRYYRLVHTSSSFAVSAICITSSSSRTCLYYTPVDYKHQHLTK